ncbi:hypothetical protein [Streptomyces sp. NPDC001903]|uniref:hypothetical protein n=1 Tax=Streptomyces sp. NPDC001903 TaxID=3364622 RepID=UPI0036AE3E14
MGSLGTYALIFVYFLTRVGQAPDDVGGEQWQPQNVWGAVMTMTMNTDRPSARVKMTGTREDPRPKLLLDQGAEVDEHGRRPGVPSRTGTGSGPPADPDRVDRARREGKDRKAAGEEPALEERGLL